MEYFLAGGAVRNLLLGIAPQDLDYVFGGSAEDFLAANPKAQKLGSGPAYGLHKHEFSPLGKDIKSNLFERDFTINSFLLSEDGILHMHPAALDDLKKKRIAPSSPHTFSDDPLRIFRAARLSAQFPDFELAEESIMLMAQTAASPDFKKIPAERVGQELIKALCSPKPGNFLSALGRSHALGHWFAEFDGALDIPAGPPAYHNSDVLGHSTRIMDGAAAELDKWLADHQPPSAAQVRDLRMITIWMALCHDIGKVSTPEDILPHHYQHELRGTRAAYALAKRLKLSNRLRLAGCISAKLHMKAGIYERLRPSTRVDLLMDAWTNKLLVPLFLVAQADSDTKDLLSVAEREIKAILTVKLPPKWENRGEESGRHLREMRCAALTRLSRNAS